ncbi:MAG TPA: hypothetical protein PLB90_10950 [Opitutaceae bacterium]|nr:hypothetical protein [Opitutaceae bacterium]
MRTQLPLRSLFKSVSVALLVLGTASISRADNTIVDTGAGTTEWSWVLGGTGSNYPQSLAAQFTVTQDITVTSIEGWIGSYNDGTVRIAITDNSNGTIPGAQIWADNLAVYANTGTTWQGFTNLNLFLSAGTYWVAFIGNSDLSAGMPSGVPNPLGVEAFASSYNGMWYEQDTLDLGVRIKGNSVPDSASVVGLLGLALGAMVMVRRRLR